VQVRDRGIYIICERTDLSRGQLKDIRVFLEANGFPVVHPAFEGEAALLRDLEAESVAASDATVIYYGSAPDGWVLQKRRAILRILEQQTAAHFPRRAVYLCEPADDIKRNIYLQYSGRPMPDERARFGPLLILGDCAPFQPKNLAPLIDSLREAQ